MEKTDDGYALTKPSLARAYYDHKPQESSPFNYGRARSRTDEESDSHLKSDISVLKNMPKILTRSQKNQLPIFTPKWKVIKEDITSETGISNVDNANDLDASDEDTDDETYAALHYSKEIAERFRWEQRLKKSSMYTKEDLNMPKEQFKESDLFHTYIEKAPSSRLPESMWADNIAFDEREERRLLLSTKLVSAQSPPKPRSPTLTSPSRQKNRMNVFDGIYTWKVARAYDENKRKRTIVLKKVRMTSLNPDLFLDKHILNIRKPSLPKNNERPGIEDEIVQIT